MQIHNERHAIACHIPLDELTKIEPVIKLTSDGGDRTPQAREPEPVE